jgi:hypothetical protein
MAAAIGKTPEELMVRLYNDLLTGTLPKHPYFTGTKGKTAEHELLYEVWAIANDPDSVITVVQSKRDGLWYLLGDEPEQESIFIQSKKDGFWYLLGDEPDE